jgi:hypothetical protein
MTGKYMVYEGYYWTRSLLKEAYLNETFQGIQTRRCSKEKPESKTFTPSDPYYYSLIRMYLSLKCV